MLSQASDTLVSMCLYNYPYCLFSVVDRVLDRKHKLGDREVEVRRYLRCLGKAEGENGERKVQIPNPFTMYLAMSKVKFLKKSKACTEGLGNQMKMCKSHVELPTGKEEHVTVMCDIDPKAKGAYKEVNGWRDRAEASFEDFMKQISSSDCSVGQELMGDVMLELQSVSVENPDTAVVFKSTSDYVITVVGFKTDAGPLEKKIKKIIQDLIDKTEKAKQKTKETVASLKQLETKMLLAAKFPVNIQDDFPEISVKIILNKNEIIFEGTKADIQKAKIKMYEYKDSFEMHKLQMSKLQAELYKTKEVKEQIVKRLKGKQLVAVWEVFEADVLVMTFANDIKESVNIVKGSVISSKIGLNQASRSVVQSQQWQRHCDDIRTKHTGLVVFDTTNLDNVAVVAIEYISQSVVEGVKEYLRVNTILEEKVQLSKFNFKLLETHHHDEISKIAKSLQQFYVQISLTQSNAIEIRGSLVGIEQAKTAVEALVAKISTQKHSVKKTGLGRYTASDKGHELLGNVEKTNKVVVSTDDDEDNDENQYDNILPKSDTYDIVANNLQVRAKCVAYGTRNIMVAYGDMTEVKVDAIVNTADANLSLAGGLGKALVQKGKLHVPYLDSYIK